MTEPKFTKGPWSALEWWPEKDPSAREYVVHGPEDENGSAKIIATVRRNRKYNQHLIAAAPDMYELLVGISIAPAEGYLFELVDDIDALLVKARGESEGGE